MAGISDDVENLRVNRGDFMNALEEVHPAFGVSEEELQQVIQNGIIHYDSVVDVSINLTFLFTCLTQENRNSYGRANSSWNKFGPQHVRLSSVYYFMALQDPVKQRWGRLLLRHQSSHSSS